MKKITFNETSLYVNGDKCKNNVYDFINKDIGCARSIITGRYPLEGYCINEECTELIYVLDGSGTLCKEDGNISFEKDDAIIIDKGEKFYWDGNCIVLAVCAPAWFESQHKEIK